MDFNRADAYTFLVVFVIGDSGGQCLYAESSCPLLRTRHASRLKQNAGRWRPALDSVMAK